MSKRQTAFAIMVLFAIASPSHAKASPFAFRDFAVGDSEVQHKDSLRACSKDNVGLTERYCFFRPGKLGTIAGQQVVFGQVGFVAGKLATIEFILHSGSFEAVAEAFFSKWGEPCEISAPTVRTGAGASYTNDTRTWCFADGKITASRHFEKVANMRVFFRTTALVDAETRKPPVDF